MSPRENHRERLLRGALACLREKGYAHTTARDIAAASESNLGSIGYHFGSKEALMNEAIRQGSAEWIEQLGRIAFSDHGATPIEHLQAAWRGLADTFDEHRPLILAFMEALVQAQRSEELRGMIVWQECPELFQNAVGIDPPVGRLCQTRGEHLKQAQLHDGLP